MDETDDRLDVARFGETDHTETGRSALLGLPEDLRDLVDLVEQLLRLARVNAALAAGSAGSLGRVVEELVQLRVLLEVWRLEVVGPEHPQVVLDELGPLLLDEQGAGAENRVLVALVLLADRLDRLGLDTCLCRVVNAAGQVAVCVDDGLGCEQAHDGPFGPLLIRVGHYPRAYGSPLRGGAGALPVRRRRRCRFVDATASVRR